MDYTKNAADYDVNAAIEAGNTNVGDKAELSETSNDYIFGSPERGMIPKPSMRLDAYTEGDSRSNAQLAFRHTTREDEQIFRGTGVAYNGDTDGVLKELGLDWKPETSIIRYGGIFEHLRASRQVLYRPQDGMFMDIVSEGWHDDSMSFSGIVNHMKEFCDDADITLESVGKTQRVVDEKGEPRLDLTLYAVAAINGSQQFELPGNDAVTGKLILRYPYQYGKGIDVTQMAIRRICTNGMNMPIRVGRKIISHSTNFSLNRITEALEGAKNCWGRYQQEAELLSETVMPKEVAVAKIIEQFGDANRPATDQPKLVQQLLDKWNSGNFKGGNMLSAYNTAWGLLNVATEYFNHEYGRLRDSDTVVDRLIDSTSVVNQNQAKFMASISSFAYAERERQYGASSVAQAVRAF
jgi:hypothetical protein